MTGRMAGVAALAAGLLVGGLAGGARYEKLDDKRPLCASCHHSVVDLEEVGVTPPHSTDFAAKCHGCHVLPVREYAVYSLAAFGLSAPEWIDHARNPVIGGQTCLECHLARGRGVVACEKCHADGTLDVRLDEGCDACHDDQTPIAPHDGPACQDCHPEVYLDPHGRKAQLMDEKLGGHHVDR